MEYDDLFLKPEDAPHDNLADPLRSNVGEKFWNLITWHCEHQFILDDGIFDQNGSVLLIRGEY